MDSYLCRFSAAFLCVEEMEVKPRGRPTKYRPEMCEEVVVYMAQGMSLCEVAAKLGIRRETLWDWTRKNEDFSNSIKVGTDLSQAWWEDIARNNILQNTRNDGSPIVFNTSLWFMNMKNRFKDEWKDKHEVEQVSTIKIEHATKSDDQLESEILALIPQD